jgi:hypothetical protein
MATQFRRTKVSGVVFHTAVDFGDPIAIKKSFQGTIGQPVRAASVQQSGSFCRIRNVEGRSLTAIRVLFRGQDQGRSKLLSAVAGLCLVLLALLAVAQVAHLHSSSTDADHCQLCIVMHTVVPVTPVAAAIVLVQLGASAPQAEPIVVARQRQIRLFIRPPPVSC